MDAVNVTNTSSGKEIYNRTRAFLLLLLIGEVALVIYDTEFAVSQLTAIIAKNITTKITKDMTKNITEDVLKNITERIANEVADHEVRKEAARNAIPMLLGVVVLVVLYFIIGFVSIMREDSCMMKAFAVTMNVFNIFGAMYVPNMGLLALVNYILCWLLTAMAYYVAFPVAKKPLKSNGSVTKIRS
ncbi:hypothetical protein HDE_07740 [Halotydeus destructor]|nr:hypothetical protein HDE_07740 [Halotydeus destructor]